MRQITRDTWKRVIIISLINEVMWGIAVWLDLTHGAPVDGAALVVIAAICAIVLSALENALWDAIEARKQGKA